MKWTQKELEELYRKANEKGANDPEFAKKLKENAKAALEELAGCELPEGFALEPIVGDSKYAAGVDLDELAAVAGGAAPTCAPHVLAPTCGAHVCDDYSPQCILDFPPSDDSPVHCTIDIIAGSSCPSKNGGYSPCFYNSGV